MKRCRIPGLLFAVALAACSTKPFPNATLAGQWLPRSAELGGQAFPVTNFGGASLRLTADQYEFAGDRGTYALLAQGPPRQMDIVGREGPNAGRTIKAIYELAGDQLVICYQLGPGERPTEFSSPQGSRILLVRYRRMQ